MKLFLRISYLGTAYNGYQTQKNGTGIQQVINKAAKQLFGHDCDICGCSRTDKGVHANEFCLTVCDKGKNSLDTSVKTESIVKAMNVFLPDDIAVLGAEWKNEDFHPRYCVKSKEYVYRIYNSPVRSPFENGRSLHYPKYLDDTALERMSRAADLLEGEHDFRAFMASGSKITDCKRNIIKTSVIRNGDIILFYIRADGFLYNMVRIIVGTLLEVAENKKEPSDIPDIILSRDRKNAGRTVSAEGLYLNRVFY